MAYSAGRNLHKMAAFTEYEFSGLAEINRKCYVCEIVN